MAIVEEVAVAPLPIATLLVLAVAPAVDASPLPIAMALAALALAPLTAAPSDAPMAMAPWALARGDAVVLVPPPMAIVSLAVVARAFSPMAMACVDEAAALGPTWTEFVPDPSVENTVSAVSIPDESRAWIR
jgi:hypothetical protein